MITIGEFYVPTRDTMFQLLFGRNKNKALTDNFIKAVLKYENENINLNNINIKSEVAPERLAINDKFVRLDVIADYDEATVCIEMQNQKNSNIYQRARCYATKISAMQLQAGEDYLNLKPLIMIVILNYKPDNFNEKDYIEHIITVNKQYRDMQIKMGIKFIFIFLKNIKNKDLFNPENEFIHWLKFIEYKDLEVLDMINTMNIHTKLAKDELERINADREEKRIAEIIENGLLDARLEYTAGVDAGKLSEKFDIIRKMLNKKYNISEIISLTGISENEILKLAKEIK